MKQFIFFLITVFSMVPMAQAQRGRQRGRVEAESKRVEVVEQYLRQLDADPAGKRVLAKLGMGDTDFVGLQHKQKNHGVENYEAFAELVVRIARGDHAVRKKPTNATSEKLATDIAIEYLKLERSADVWQSFYYSAVDVLNIIQGKAPGKSQQPWSTKEVEGFLEVLKDTGLIAAKARAEGKDISNEFAFLKALEARGRKTGRDLVREFLQCRK